MNALERCDSEHFIGYRARTNRAVAAGSGPRDERGTGEQVLRAPLRGARVPAAAHAGRRVHAGAVARVAAPRVCAITAQVAPRVCAITAQVAARDDARSPRSVRAR
jgi:hypothetical protein